MLYRIKVWDKENTLFAVNLLITFVVVYFSPTILFTRLVFFMYLIIIFLSKKDYFWLAWVFIIVDAPGYLFKGYQIADPQRIPAYPISSSISLSFFDLLIIMYLLKLLTSNRRSVILFIKEYKVFLSLIVIYILLSYLLFSVNFINLYRTLIPWSFVAIIMHFMSEERFFLKFNKLIYPIVFFILFTEIYSLVQGEHLVNGFKQSGFEIKAHLDKKITENSVSAARNLYCVFLIIYIITTALFDYSKKVSAFPKKYLTTIITVSFLTVLLTGTRGYLLAIVFIIVISIYISQKNKNAFLKNIGLVIFLFIGIYLLSFMSPIIQRQMYLVTQRYETLFLFIQGDVTAGGTLQRINVRLPEILKWINESPIVGYGFSKIYFENADGDIGFFTVILNVGYFGVIFLFGVLISVLVKIYRISRSSYYQYSYQKSGYVFGIGIIGVFIFHSTTNIAFGLTPSAQGALYERYLIYGLLLTYFNTTYISSQRNIRKIGTKK